MSYTLFLIQGLFIDNDSSFIRIDDLSEHELEILLGIFKKREGFDIVIRPFLEGE